MTSQRSYEFLQAGNVEPGEAGEGVTELKTLLASYGYLEPGRAARGQMEAAAAEGAITGPSTDRFDEETVVAIRRYQEFFSLPVTGRVDEATAASLAAPRCGVADVGRRALATLHRTWPHSHVTYDFANYTDDLPKDQVEAAIAWAFGLWEAHCSLSFSRSVANPDIRILFAAGYHGHLSGYPADKPFDGPGYVLAHAYPPGSESIAGDVHFDDSEIWAVTLPVPAGKYDLMSVAAHEIGHSLGLDHSGNPASLMHPHNHRQRHLDPSDIQAIRALYGA